MLRNMHSDVAKVMRRIKRIKYTNEFCNRFVGMETELVKWNENEWIIESRSVISLMLAYCACDNY